MHVSNFGISVLFFIDSGKFVSCQLPEAVELQEHKMWVELAWLFIHLFIYSFLLYDLLVYLLDYKCKL